MSTPAYALPAPRPAVLGDVVPRSRARDAVLVLAGVALTAALAQVAIVVPGSPVPITGQTLAVVLVGASLGARRGATAMGVYALLGLALPIYTEGGHGLSVIWGASGGYIVGFVLAAAAIGWLAERGADRMILSAFGIFVVGQLIVFGIGVPWLKVATGGAWGGAIHDGFTIFIVGGLVKAAIAGLVTPSAWSLARRFESRD